MRVRRSPARCSAIARPAAIGGRRTAVDAFGSFALRLAFLCAAYAFVGGIAAIVTRHPLLIKSARQAGIATCGLIFVATGSLVYLFFSDSYWVSYVVAHSNRDLAAFYKVAALWSGQEGSLLFWSFLVAICVFSVLLVYRNKNGELMPYVGVVLAGVQIFFLTLNNFVASPFKVLAAPGANGALEIFTRADGNGLTPLLQYPEMVIHPPNLYFGYTGFTIPFAVSLGALVTRSGVVSSVHAFAQSSIGEWFVGFLLLAITVCFVAYVKNRDYLKSENRLDSMISRESSFLFNNLILLVSCIAVLSGTLFPVFSEWFSGSKISVGAPFFNKVNIPIGLLLLFLTGVGPLLAWRKTSADSLKRNFAWPLLAGLLAGAVFFAIGVREKQQ